MSGWWNVCVLIILLLVVRSGQLDYDVGGLEERFWAAGKQAAASSLLVALEGAGELVEGGLCSCLSDCLLHSLRDGRHAVLLAHLADSAADEAAGHGRDAPRGGRSAAAKPQIPPSDHPPGSEPQHSRCAQAPINFSTATHHLSHLSLTNIYSPKNKQHFGFSILKNIILHIFIPSNNKYYK